MQLRNGARASSALSFQEDTKYDIIVDITTVYHTLRSQRSKVRDHVYSRDRCFKFPIIIIYRMFVVKIPRVLQCQRSCATLLANPFTNAETGY